MYIISRSKWRFDGGKVLKGQLDLHVYKKFLTTFRMFQIKIDYLIEHLLNKLAHRKWWSRSRTLKSSIFLIHLSLKVVSKRDIYGSCRYKHRHGSWI